MDRLPRRPLPNRSVYLAPELHPVANQLLDFVLGAERVKAVRATVEVDQQLDISLRTGVTLATDPNTRTSETPRRAGMRMISSRLSRGITSVGATWSRRRRPRQARTCSRQSSSRSDPITSLSVHIIGHNRRMWSRR